MIFSLMGETFDIMGLIWTCVFGLCLTMMFFWCAGILLRGFGLELLRRCFLLLLTREVLLRMSHVLRVNSVARIRSLFLDSLFFVHVHACMHACLD